MIMQIKVSKSQLKAKALEYFRQIETTGESLIVTDHGQPTIEIKPFHLKKTNPLALLQGTALRFDDPFAPINEEDWESNK